jgi:cytochrome c oxidase cbb3-type subunit I/II
MRTLGVPYPDGYEKIALQDLRKQADAISDNLKSEKIKVNRDKEVIALIAYLQRLGTDIKSK